MKIDFRDKSDEELIRIMDDQTSSNLTHTIRTAAKIELHRRQAGIDKSTNTLTRWILWLTLFISVMTAILLVFQWCSSFYQPKQSSGLHDLSKTHDSTKDDKRKN